jgi:hypothetical protein
VQEIGSSAGVVSTGARLVLPLFRERLLLSAGDGYSWLRSSEHVVTGSSNVKSECTSCRSIGGSGPTEIVEIMWMLERRAGIGFHVRNVQIKSSGLAPAASVYYPSGMKFKDRFFLIGGEVSIRFGRRD